MNPIQVGVPSPNPDYLQAIEQAESVQLNIYNKNLLKSYTNGDSKKYSNALYIDFDCDTTKKYVLSFIDNSVGNQYYRNEYFIKSYKYYRFISIGKRQTYYFTAKTMDKNSNAYVAGKGWVLLKCEKDQTLAPNFTDVMLEEVDDFNSQPSEYEPIKNQAINIDLKGNKLCAVSNTIKDKLLIDRNGNVALQKNVNFINMEETNYNWMSASEVEEGYTAFCTTDLHLILKRDGGLICNYFTYLKYDGNDGFRIKKSNEAISDGGSYRRLYFRLKTGRLETNDIAGFKKFLKDNNIILYYSLETPEIIDLGQLTELPKTFNGINNIWAETNLGNTQIEIEYVQDVKKLIENLQALALDNAITE